MTEEFERNAESSFPHFPLFKLMMDFPREFPKTHEVRFTPGDNSSGYNSSSSTSSLFHSFQKPVTVFNNERQFLPTMESPVQRAIMERPSRIQFMKESVTNILDQIDARVSFLRETAFELEEEKRKLFGVLSSIKDTNDLSYLSTVDREDIFANTDRLFRRLNSVEVQVLTTRNEEQSKALEAVESFIDNLVKLFSQDSEQASHICAIYLNTCSSENTFGVIDEKFQKAILACTADDQKKTRKRLESLNLTFNHAVNSMKV